MSTEYIVLYVAVTFSKYNGHIPFAFKYLLASLEPLRGRAQNGHMITFKSCRDLLFACSRHSSWLSVVFLMPECRELLFQYLQVIQWLENACSKPDWDPALCNIYLDVTKAKCETAKSNWHRNGYIDSISQAVNVERGSKSIQTPVFPPMSDSLDELLGHQVRLTGIEHTGRSIILVFGDLLCQVRTYCSLSQGV